MKKEQESKIISKIKEICQRGNYSSVYFESLKELYFETSSTQMTDDLRIEVTRKIVSDRLSSKKGD
jgi:hypothetical protein